MPTPARFPSRLAAYLTQEAGGLVYTDALLEWAEAVAGGDRSGFSGNAFFVEPEGDCVVIEHQFDDSWEPLRVPLDDFRAALADHRRTLDRQA